MAETVKKAKGGKKNRKYGRNARRCAAYKARSQREHNKLVRIARHLRRFPEDKSGHEAFDRVRSGLGMRIAT